MLNTIAKPFVRLVERYLPDPYIFVLILTLVAFAAAMLVEGNSPHAVMVMWGDGFWGLLTFSMQMLLVLVTGFMLASTPLVKGILNRLASLARTPGQAILLVTYVALAASWINWGFGLVVGGLFAKALARQVRVHYPLLIAAAYSGFIVWHGGLAGSIPLTIATEGHFTQEQIGIIGTGQTIFSFFNLAIVVMLFIAVPLVNRWMLPPEEDSHYVDAETLKDGTEVDVAVTRPAEHLENSRILAWLIGFSGIAYAINYFAGGGGLNLNIVNFMFLFLAIVLHQTPRRLLNSLQEAIKGGAGIVIQFPFYAGIMAVMTQSGLAATISNGFVSIASADSLPFWSFISAGVVNIFVPSGGGQWAVQAPVMIPAAQELGADLPRVAMAVGWGDAWTNLLQPFWALPVLAIAGLKAKDIMGFCLVQLIITGALISIGLTWF
ncbi:short-chain fatty acid transporter [Alloalcanivorax xenomutans]|jgi:short-chain fatty acids transporter|uniref:short-chain fatty acid transporter n=1 Tax=Alloalcanivorax xenomutans TaxID=1094342 RepID=UPI0003B8A24C|nr:short-chain fatty acid transporter [Alloalcanivorax xenomutans]ERS10660.1 short-chain fatty acid transporter [Alcanivorax sp. PN-3]MBA4720933.1 short-chain fatty acid transporter [Alcanivorax sp.]PHS70507.1 MAG: short-chain fatty acid transporter [Alcanivorax sp.]WOD28813.1 short-chain fatty acid transporter [Alloalcanivorax xenomutans]CUR45968.1 Short chain fatty acids transporter [Alloalcanivorax xenomutans]